MFGKEVLDGWQATATDSSFTRQTSHLLMVGGSPSAPTLRNTMVQSCCLSPKQLRAPGKLPDTGMPLQLLGPQDHATCKLQALSTG
jgi:hypothetical protein